MHVYLSISIRLNHDCCGNTSCCSFLRERERVHLSPHIPFDPAFARWVPVWLAPMAPPLRRQSEFQEFAFDAIDYRTVLSIFSSSTGSKRSPCVMLTDHFLCVLFDGEPHRSTDVTFATQSLRSMHLLKHYLNLMNMTIFNTTMCSS